MYTFSLILAVFLTGLGIGSSSVHSWRGEPCRAAFALVLCQCSCRGHRLDRGQISQSLPTGQSSRSCRRALVHLSARPDRCLWAVLPPACLGEQASAGAAASLPGQDPGRLVGGVYAANTIGGIAGALVFSLLLIPVIGTAGASGC